MSPIPDSIGTMPILRKRSRIPASAQAVFAWHEEPEAFERLRPPWEPVRVLEKHGGIREGDRLVIGIKQGPFLLRWVAEHRDYHQNESFTDVQVKGPFKRWEHTHRMIAEGPESCLLEDTIVYTLPFAAISQPLLGWAVRRKLDRLFEYRHRVTREAFEGQAGTRRNGAMKILVSGSTGLVGSALVRLLSPEGHQIVRLVRHPSKGENEIQWDIDHHHLEASNLEGFDAVVHLAGENIASRRWNDAQKKKIRDSRVEGTLLLAEKLSELTSPPKVLVAASAIGWYGNRGSGELQEDSGLGEGFLAEVCKQWEGATAKASEKGIRVVNLRFGVILSGEGGPLTKMLPPFKMGVGGTIGDGSQYMSWIALEDAIGVIRHVLTNESLAGPVNATAPHPVTNREFTKTLGRVLGRPTVFPMPAFAARLAFGQMADELLLASACVIPKRLLDAGYPFRYPDLENALRQMVGRG